MRMEDPDIDRISESKQNESYYSRVIENAIANRYGEIKPPQSMKVVTELRSANIAEQP